MANFLLTLMLILTVGKILSLEIYNEDSKLGLIFKHNQQISIRERYHNIYFIFDVTIMSYISTWKENLHPDCDNNKYFIKFNSNNISWNAHNPEPENIEGSVDRIGSEIHYVKSLNININTLNNAKNDSVECQALSRIASTFNKLNLELNKLANLETTSLNEILPLNVLAASMAKLVQRQEGDYHLPFSLTYNFGTEVFKYVEFHFYQRDDIITLGFRVPLYKKTKRFNVFKKPLVKNNKPYIFELNSPLFMRESDFIRSCFRKMGNLFCEKPNYNSFCENEALNENVPQECLEEMKKTNMITMIDDDIFIKNFDGMIIGVNCTNSIYSVRLDTHARLINNMGCILNATNFYYDPNNVNFARFKIFFLQGNHSYTIFESLNSFEPDLTDLLITIGGFLVTIISNVTTIIVCCFKLKRTKDKYKDIDLKSEQASSIHMYATISDT